MLSDIKKSFNEIIYERTTSPFYGTLICSWLIWNWKIIYLTLFISEDKLCENKIDYIIKNYSQSENIIWYPLASTILILTIIPFLSNGAYWLSLIFNKWKVEKKNEVDRKQLLSLEQSIELREEMSSQEEKFGKLIESKNKEIDLLKLKLSEYNNDLNSKKSTKSEEDDSLNHINVDVNYLSERIRENTNEKEQFEYIMSLIQGGFQITGKSDIDSTFIGLLESYDIIENQGKGVYKFTEKGKNLQKLILK
nr:hypothetical protein [uncultured Flavobacterium sp.]